MAAIKKSITMIAGSQKRMRPLRFSIMNPQGIDHLKPIDPHTLMHYTASLRLVACLKFKRALLEY
jgi:hypothetical protein